MRRSRPWANDTPASSVGRFRALMGQMRLKPQVTPAVLAEALALEGDDRGGRRRSRGADPGSSSRRGLCPRVSRIRPRLGGGPGGPRHA